jgi:DNA replication protein DnaC
MLESRPQPAGEAHCSFETCDGSGFLVDEATNTARDCACRAQRIANARAHRLRDRVPRRYMDLSWDRYPLTQIAQDPNADSVRVVKRFCTDIQRNLAVGKGMWLMGHTGTGKTTLGYMVAAAAARSQHSVLSFNAVALLNRIRATFNSDSRETPDQVIETLANVDLLHIEDLRVVRPTEWVLEQLYLIVNARYEGQRSIVFSTDIDSDADGPLAPEPWKLEEHVGKRIYSRLMEICDTPIVIAGNDNRLESPDKRLDRDARTPPSSLDVFSAMPA